VSVQGRPQFIAESRAKQQEFPRRHAESLDRAGSFGGGRLSGLSVQNDGYIGANGDFSNHCVESSSAALLGALTARFCDMA